MATCVHKRDPQQQDGRQQMQQQQQLYQREDDDRSRCSTCPHLSVPLMPAAARPTSAGHLRAQGGVQAPEPQGRPQPAAASSSSNNTFAAAAAAAPSASVQAAPPLAAGETALWQRPASARAATARARTPSRRAALACLKAELAALAAGSSLQLQSLSAPAAPGLLDMSAHQQTPQVCCCAVMAMALSEQQASAAHAAGLFVISQVGPCPAACRCWIPPSRSS